MQKKKGKRGRPKGSKNKPVKPAKILKNADEEITTIAEKLNRLINMMNEIEGELKAYRNNPNIKALIKAGKPKRKYTKKKSR